MSDQEPQSQKPESPSSFSHSTRIGSLFGIDIYLDASVMIIFALVVWILGGNVFPGWHPEWGLALSWATGLMAGLLFFASLLAHEMAHSVVARGYGIPVPRITLFMFGGVSEMQEEPETPKKEFWIAIVGPAMSLFLGVVFTLLANALAPANFAATLAEDQQAALASLAPLPTLLFWLGPVNFLLAIFNLVPGFPLDGGRVLRAGLWWMTGNLEQATRWAAAGGRIFGWFLMLVGALEVLSGMFQGLWLILIGWFLASAASSSYSQLMMRRTLQGCRVRDVMRTHFETVDADMTVAEFIDDYLLKSSQRLWPVTSDGRLQGFASLEIIQDIESAERGSKRLRDVMRSDLESLTVAADADAMKATERMSYGSLPMAVVRGDEVVGLLSQEDVVKWLTLHPRDRLTA
ncbi:MAG TPA: site-2 protease family protein [Arenicellales bacterium]|nr:site-2 protease family protein [Arenicellales bacterium]